MIKKLVDLNFSTLKLSSNMGLNALVETKKGTKITVNQDNSLAVPDDPIIPFIEGDGVGGDIWMATKKVINAAVKKSYQNKKKVHWLEVYAGQKAFDMYGDWLPEDTLQAIEEHIIAIKGPLTTPLSGGIRSLNVALRQKLDLFACIRPVKYLDGTPSPLKNPEKTDLVIFRENTEDLYCGIEWEANSSDCKKVINFLREEMGENIRMDSGIGIKPISAFATKRLVRMAIEYAITHNKKSVTLVHKANIMKFTEGGFLKWGYEVALKEFAEKTITEDRLHSDFGGEIPPGKVLIKDRIADSMFQQVLLRPEEYEVIALPNLNGDYLSDACAAQTGGLGMAPGANIGIPTALFEATHGTAPKYAGKDKINPGSLILSGCMMLDHMGWKTASDLITNALQITIANKTVTYDLARQLKGARELKCSEFGDELISNMEKTA